MESIIRTSDKKDITLKDFYIKIKDSQNCPQFYRKVNLLLENTDEEQNEYFIMEALGRGRIGFVFLAYHQRKLTALKMSYQNLEKEDIFSTVKKTTGEDYKKYFLRPTGKPLKIDSFYLGGVRKENKIYFDRDIFVTSWEPADATLTEKLEESFVIKLKWFKHFLKGLTIIHSRDRAHFDIKLENLFLVGNQLKIGDFEFYLKIDDFKQSDIQFCGTPGHIAPELFYNRENINSKIDIFSAGIAFALLFTAQPFEGTLTLTRQEEKDLNELFRFTDANEFITDSDFQDNFKISHFYESQVIKQLEAGQLPETEKTIYNLLLKMMELDPGKRPTADLLLKEAEAIDSFARLMKTHDKKELIKYCLVPDLLEKLKYDKIEDKIMGVQFKGNDYEKRFFSFKPLEKETKIRLFGKDFSSETVKNDKDWNSMVIIGYWNQSFKLGLDKPCGSNTIDTVLDTQNLEKVDRKIFKSKIKETGKQVVKLRKKIKSEE